MTHVTDGVTDDIVWIQDSRMPWFNTRLGHLKKCINHTFVFYIICIYYIYRIYVICILYILYITYIYRVKICVIEIGLHFQHILVDPSDRLSYGGHRLDTRYEDALVQYQAGSSEKRKSIHLIYVLYIFYI